MSVPYDSWTEISLEVERIFRVFKPHDQSQWAKQAFDEETIQNVREFLIYAAAHFPIPNDIDHGYWPTICLYWANARPYPVNIEIFGTHFEFWRRIHKVVDVSHFDHKPGTPFPEELAQILSAELR